jgi:carboxypeptidase Q
MLRALIAVLLVSAQSFPQEADPEGDPVRSRAQTMLREALRSEAAHGTLARLLGAAPGRLSGTPAYDAARAFAVQEMKSVGLSAVREETMPVPRWRRGRTCSVRLFEPEGPEEGILLPALALGGSVGTGPSPILAEVVAFTTFPELRRDPERAAGRIVLWNRPMDRSLVNTGAAYGAAAAQRTQGAVEAASCGALAVLVRSLTLREDDLPHTGAMQYQDGVPRIPAAAISTKAAGRIQRLLDDGHKPRISIEMDCGPDGEALGANVIGEIPGREIPGEIVLIGAHLDSWDVCEGAHDDGAGVAHVLEACRLILATGERPRRTIRAVLYANEENGLAGARHYAEAHARELDRHVAAIETDSGGFAPRGFSAQGGQRLLEALRPAGALLAALDLGDIRAGHGGADISTLGPAGVPLLGLRTAPERYFDLHHTVADRLETVHPRELALGAASLAILAYALAEAPEALPRTQPGGR